MVDDEIEYLWWEGTSRHGGSNKNRLDAGYLPRMTTTGLSGRQTRPIMLLAYRSPAERIGWLELPGWTYNIESHWGTITFWIQPHRLNVSDGISPSEPHNNTFISVYNSEPYPGSSFSSSQLLNSRL